MSQQFSNVPNELAITPLPTPLITPPVTNIYFIVNLFCSTIAWLLNLRGAILKNFGTLHKNRKHTDCRWRMLKRICEQRCRTARKWNCAQHSEHNQRLFFFCLFYLFIFSVLFLLNIYFCWNKCAALTEKRVAWIMHGNTHICDTRARASLAIQTSVCATSHRTPHEWMNGEYFFLLFFFLFILSFVCVYWNALCQLVVQPVWVLNTIHTYRDNVWFDSSCGVVWH